MIRIACYYTKLCYRLCIGVEQRKGITMKRTLAIAMIALTLSGCASTNCKKVGITPVYNQETGMNDWVDQMECKKDNGFRWYHAFLVPVAILGGLAGLQRSVVDSPHYKAGGDSYVDYTKQ